MALFAAVSLYAADLNIYASGLKATQTESSVTIDYVLNTQADSLYFMIYGENINEALFMVETDPAALTKGAHQVVKPIPSNTPAGTYHWAIRAFASPTQLADAAAAVDQSGKFYYYLPQDVIVDNNFESPFFGRVYVSESTNGAGDGASFATKNQTRGLYIYNPDFTFVNGDSIALHGFDGGIGGNAEARQGFKRLAIDKDGYVYVASRDATNKGIYRMDPADPSAPFVQILSATETVDAIEIVGNHLYTIEGIGVGVGTLNKYALANPLGAPIATIGQDSLIHFVNGDCAARDDHRGGFWMINYRGQLDAYNLVAHLNANGTPDCILGQGHNDSLITSSYRGTIAVNPAGDMIAISTNGHGVICSVAYDQTTGVPTLTKLHEIATPLNATGVPGANVDGVAFDVANNFYMVCATRETMQVFPMPKTDNSFVTPAPSASKIYIGVPIPVQHMYLIGDNTGWNPTQGIEMTCTADNVFEGVFTFSNDTNYFAFFDALAENNDQGGWDYVNAHRYAGKEDNLLLNHSAWKDSLRLANHTFRIPAGQYKLKVNLNDQVITVFYQAPAAIPDNALYISFKDVEGQEGSDSGSSVTAIADIIKSGADLISAIPTASKIYNAREGLGVKFGTSSAKGELTLTLANAVIPEKIIVNAVAYGGSEGTGVLMGDTVDLKANGNKVINPYTKTYDGLTPVTELTFSTTAKRMYLLDVIIIPAGETPQNVYRIKHPWDLNNIDPWIWKDCEEQVDGTWVLEDLYWGTGCDIEPAVLNTNWIESPVLVGNPYNGDSCRFVINPAATDVAGILTITKLGDPNPDTTVVVYDHLYEIGANQGWKPDAGVEMTKKADNVFEGDFTFTGSSDSGYDYFGFITELNASWDVVNQHRFGPASDGVIVEIGDNAMFENKGAGYSFKIAAGSYTFTVDINTMKLTIAPITGIKNVEGESNVQKVLRNGQIFIIRDGETYTVTGAKVE